MLLDEYREIKTNDDRRRKWFLTFLTGFLVAFFSFCVKSLSILISNAKFTSSQNLLSSGRTGLALLEFISVNVLMVLMSSILVAYVSPKALGSGIPELKCIVKRISVKDAITYKTLFVKTIGVVGSVSGGLPVGFEGPMLHYGAIIGAKLSKYVDDPEEVYDMMSCGLAAGVACAFNAPIGGVLFSIEEGCAKLDLELLQRAFFCSVVASNFLNLFMQNEGYYVFGTMDIYYPVHFYEYVFFSMLGIMGGLFGSFFNALNTRATHLRQVHVSKPWMKVIESISFSILLSLISFGVSYYMGECITKTKLGRRFTCGEGYTNDLGTLLLNQSENVVQLLFLSDTIFSLKSLIIYCLLYFMFACLVYGLAIPSGLFVPNILIGASIGRFIGELLRLGIKDIHPGIYAFVGAAVMLGGMARLTISFVVILIEATGDLRQAFFIMIPLFITKRVGDCFNESLYDIHIKLQGRVLF